MKKKEQKTKKIILVLIAIVLVIFLYYILTIPSEKPVDSEIEEILTKFNLNRNTTQITRLTNLEELKQKYPVIYGEAKPGDYEIITPGKLIIYDYDNDTVIKEFDITQISIG